MVFFLAAEYIPARLPASPAGGRALRSGPFPAQDPLAVGLEERRRPQLALAAAHRLGGVLAVPRLPQRHREVEVQERLVLAGVAALAEVADGLGEARGPVGELRRRVLDPALAGVAL